MKMSANPASIMDHNPVDYELFFDGGSRGNPGPGGSGTIIVHIQESTMAYKAIRAASISYNPQSTTNNKAEY